MFLEWDFKLKFRGQFGWLAPSKTRKLFDKWFIKLLCCVRFLTWKMVRLPRNKKQTYRWNARPQMGSSGLTLAMTLTLNFQDQIWNLLYLSQKWSDCHETKSKHIDWTLGLKWDHRVWFWPWPWPWIFKVKSKVCYISAENSLDCHERKSKHIDWTPGLKSDQDLERGGVRI